MELAKKEKQLVTAKTAPRYRKAGRKAKSRILDEFVALTGYSRCYARWLLREWGRVHVLGVGGVERRLVVGRGRKAVAVSGRRVYDERVVEVLKVVWAFSGEICGKRLAVVAYDFAVSLQRAGKLPADAETVEKLRSISGASIDRLLSAEKRKGLGGKLRVRRRSSNPLLSQVPVRTFAECDRSRPGFLQIDLVSHDGGDARGEFLYTLVVTDPCLGWTEFAAVRNKAQRWVFEALLAITARLPFGVTELHSDNGSEFLNAHLVRYYREQQIALTRSRPYRKNDNCFVEQKNGAVIRRAVGYGRYDTEKELGLLNELYGSLRLWTNLFLPTAKLISKERDGAKVKKQFEPPKTPYQRALESEAIAGDRKARLRRERGRSTAVKLQEKITALQERLWELHQRKETSERR